MKLKSKTVVPYTGEVVDLCVENTHTYNVDGISVHNSGGGSLVAFVLYIHDMDPLRWDLPFSRFLSIYRCLDPKTLVLMADGSEREIGTLQQGEFVIADDGSSCEILNTTRSKHDKVYKITTKGVTIRCSTNHRWIVKNHITGHMQEKLASQLTCDDEVYVASTASEGYSYTNKISNIEIEDVTEELVDIEVADRHKFWVSDKGTDWVLTHNCGSPDIDTDVSDRDKVLDELRGFFGFNNVVPISTYNVLKLKSLIKDLSKFYGVPFEEANTALKTVEDDVRKAVTKHGDDKNLFVLKYEDAIGFVCKDELKNGEQPVCDGCSPKCTKPVSPTFKAFLDKHPEISESIQVLFKQNRSLGRHAGGVLIVDDLPNKMPLITSDGEPQAPWQEGVTIKHLEYIGNFIKYDLLGLETMRLIERTIELILEQKGCYELDVEGQKYTLSGDQSVMLSDGTWCKAADLTSDSDIMMPVQVKRHD